MWLSQHNEDDHRTTRRRPARRSLWALGAVVCGYAAARAWGIASDDAGWVLIWACGLLVGALLSRGVVCSALLWVATAVVACGWFGVRVGSVPADRVDVLVAGAAPPGTERSTVVLEGIVVDGPEVADVGRGALARFVPMRVRSRMVLSVRSVGGGLDESGKGVGAGGRVWVSVAGGGGRDVRAGDAVRLMGAFRPSQRAARLPGGEVDVLWSNQGGWAGSVSVPNWELVQRVERSGGVRESAWRAYLHVRHAVRSRLMRVFDVAGDGGDVLRALVLGERGGQFGQAEQAFARTGLIHLLAISGFHVGVLVGAVVVLVRLTGDRPVLERMLVVAVVLGFMVIVPGRAPIVRAGLMVLGFVLAESFGRRYDRLTVLGWIAVVVAAWRPMEVFSLGYQLSFGCVAALMWVAPRVMQRVERPRVRGTVEPAVRTGSAAAWRHGRAWLIHWSKMLVVASVVCWAVALPVVACHVGRVSLVAPAAAVVATPIVVVLMVLAYGTAVCGLAVPAAGSVVAGWLAVAGAAVVSGVQWVDGLGVGSVGVPVVSVWWVIAAEMVVVYWLLRGTWRDRRAWLATAVVLAWMLVSGGANQRTAADVLLRVDALDVGSGSCYVVRSGGRAVLYDVGSEYVGFGERDLVRSLRSLGVWRIDAAIISHANMDHYSALPDLAGAMHVGRVCTSQVLLDHAAAHDEGPEAEMLRLVRQRGVPIGVLKAGDEFPCGAAVIRVLGPVAGQPAVSMNDSSLVAQLEVKTRAGPRAVLMTGDIERAGIAELVERTDGTGLFESVVVMELPHHGSYNTASDALVKQVDPLVVMQSTDASRLADVRWNARKFERAWLTTPERGSIAVELLADGTVRTMSVLTPEPVVYE